MLRTYTLLCTTIILILFSGCDKKTEIIQNGLNDQLGFNQEEYENVFRKSIVIPDTLSTLFETVGKDLDTIKYYYSTQNYKPIFLKSFESENFLYSLINILSKAGEHGLNPVRYNYIQIYNEFSESIKPNIDNNRRYFHLANAELLIANAILKYSTHMRHGVVNPRKLYFDRYYLPVTDSLNNKLFEPFKQNNIITYLETIQPKSEKYKKLQTALKRFDSLKELEWTSIPIPYEKIKFGDSFSSLNLVANRLASLGFLDTNKVKLSEISLYDSSLVGPVTAFQRANGFNGDGIIDKSTIERLNISPKTYVDKIKLNLERFRWFDYSDTSRYILVNIPDYKLYAVESGNKIFNITVCTGRKGEWETPSLYGRISYFVLNPTWSVPRSIVEEEIVAGLRRDSSYLKVRNFKAYKYGKEVSLEGLTAKELLSSKSYILVQDPGLGNALGKIKFMFNNPFGVYLHDTPTRAPFKYVNRAVSHGCVRVEKPLQLAEYFLQDNSKWTINYLKIEIGQKVNDKSIVEEFYRKRNGLRKNFSYGVTTEVKLYKRIPLFIDYYTAWVDDNGIFNLRDDVYGRDILLMESLSDNN